MKPEIITLTQINWSQEEKHRKEERAFGEGESEGEVGYGECNESGGQNERQRHTSIKTSE